MREGGRVGETDRGVYICILTASDALGQYNRETAPPALALSYVVSSWQLSYSKDSNDFSTAGYTENAALIGPLSYLKSPQKLL